MKKELVLTVVADDRPGLVGEISKTVADHQANWVDSSMARLGGQFAGIVRVNVDKERIAELSSALLELEKSGLAIGIHVHNEGGAPDGLHAVLHILGQDQPGMISRVSSMLADLHVSIEALDSLVEPGSMSGELMFRANARVVIPPQITPAQVSEALESIAADLMIDVDLSEAADIND